MPDLSRAHEEHMRDLLRDAPAARDALPYSDAFEELKQAFWSRTFKKLTDAEFWQCIVNVAKKGGIRGKKKAEPARALTDQQRDALRDVLPLPIGERDRLPYTERFHRAVARFNAVTGLAFTPREAWLAVLHLAK